MSFDEPRPLPALVGFAQRLREAGTPVGSDQVITYCRAVARLGVSDLDDLYWAGRASLLTKAEQIPIYDEVFERCFRLAGPNDAPPENARQQSLDGHLAAAAGDAVEEGMDAYRASLVASNQERLRDKDFAKVSPEEREALEALISELRLAPLCRRSRRTAPARRGRHPDLRRTLRRSLRTDGELLHRVWRTHRTRPRRLVLLLDVSGSMADYARPLVGFAHAIGRVTADVEVFCFGTRITRITESVRVRNPDDAFAAAARQVVDWESGTRIGPSIDTFIRRWARNGLARGAVVLICSDGLERDDPDCLATSMARLSRLAYRIVWVNPLKGDPRYQALARGMVAALPHVDYFLPGHNLASLEALGHLLGELSRGRRPRPD